MLLAIPALDNLWVWTMRRFFNCCSGSDGPGPDPVARSRQRVIELHPMEIDWASPIHAGQVSENSSGIVFVAIISIPAAC